MYTKLMSVFVLFLSPLVRVSEVRFRVHLKRFVTPTDSNTCELDYELNNTVKSSVTQSSSSRFTSISVYQLPSPLLRVSEVRFRVHLKRFMTPLLIRAHVSETSNWTMASVVNHQPHNSHHHVLSNGRNNYWHGKTLNHSLTSSIYPKTLSRGKRVKGKWIRGWLVVQSEEEAVLRFCHSYARI